MSALKRVVIRLTAEKADEYLALAHQLGMSRGQLLSLAVVLGIQQIRRAYTPEELYSPKILADVVEELQKRGLSTGRKDIQELSSVRQ